jgi:uncharacterized protein (TIGR00251 family)
MSDILRCRLSVRLKPNAKREAVSTAGEGIVTVAVPSPPVDGKANAHAIRLLSEVLGVPKSSITIVHGHASRMKLFEIRGLDSSTVNRRLTETKERK